MYSIILTRSAFRLAVSRVEWNVTGYVYLQSNFDGSLLCSFVGRYYPQPVMMAVFAYGKSGQMANGSRLGVSALSRLSKSQRLINGTLVQYEYGVLPCQLLP